MDNSLNRRTKLSDLLCMLPAFVFSLSILLVRLHLFSMPMTDIYWSEATNESTLSDLFNYWKAIAIIGAACLAVIVFIAAYFKDSVRFKKSFLYIPALIYVAFVLLSFAFSDYKYFALRGMSEHFEGTIVLLAYIMMVFFLANMIDRERRLKFVVYCALGAALLLGILGITQATGHDFFSTAIGQKMMTPNYTLDTGIKSWDMIDILAASGQRAYDFSFTEGEVYQTLYNVNYVPLCISLLITVVALLFIYFERNNSKYGKLTALIFLCLFGLLLYNYFAANSASGYAGLVCSLIISIIIFKRVIKKWIRPILCLLLVIVLVMGALVGRWLPELKSIINSSFNTIFDFVYADTQIIDNFEHDPASLWAEFDFFITDKDTLKISVSGNTLLINRDESIGGFQILDESNNSVKMREIDGQPGVFELLDDKFHDYIKLSLAKDDSDYFVVVTNRRYDFPFKYNSEGFVYHNKMNKDVLIPVINHANVIKDNYWGSGRGRIWNTNIPLLGKYVIIGAGADCYAFVFPQNDYATLYSLYQESGLTLVTDKAHSLYQQYWINTGLISLLAWLTMVGYYLVGAVKQFRKRGFVDFCDFVNGGIFCGICGFLAVAFFNDGSVNTMPMFYTMLGTGLAINMRDKWPSDEPIGEMNGTDGMGSGDGKKKGKKAKAAVGAMPEM